VSVGKEKRMQMRLLLQRVGKSNSVVLDSIGVPAGLVVFVTFSGVREMWPT
jgi:hypothetical protein